MLIDLKEKKFEIDPFASDGIIKGFLRALFWLFLAALIFAFLKPKAANKWLQNAITYADEAKEKWGPKLKTWGNWFVDHVKIWSEFLLTGALRVVSFTLNVTAALVLFYTVGLAWGGTFAVAMAIPIGMLVILLTTVIILVPDRLFPGKQRTKDVLGILGMWPVAIALLIAALGITKLGLGVTVGLILIAIFYGLHGGNLKKARFAAWLVIWVAIWFHAISAGLPALQTGVAGGWAKELATGVAFWDTTRDKVADDEQDRMKVFRDRLFGVVADTTTFAVLPTLSGNSVKIERVPISIYPGERMEILSDEKAAAWGAVFNDPLLASLGDTSKHIRSAASRALGYVDVRLVAYMDPNRRTAYQEANGSVAFYVPWGNVRADPLLTAEAGALAAQQGDVPTGFTLTGTLDGKQVTSSIPATEVTGTTDADGWTTIVVDTRHPVIVIPFALAKDDELELEYVDGTVGHNRLPGGGYDPKYADNKGIYHYAHDVGPGGYAPDPAMITWKQAQVQLLDQGSPYMSLLWGTLPSNSELQKVFGFDEDYSSIVMDAPATRLYLAFNDAWCTKDGGGASFLRKQCARRVGSITIRVRIVKPEPASEQVGLAVYD